MAGRLRLAGMLGPAGRQRDLAVALVASRVVAVRVFDGNTGDPAAFTQIVHVVRDRFGLEQRIMAGDRGSSPPPGLLTHLATLTRNFGLTHHRYLQTPELDSRLKTAITQACLAAARIPGATGAAYAPVVPLAWPSGCWVRSPGRGDGARSVVVRGRMRCSTGAVITVLSTAISTRMLNSCWPIRWALNPMFSAMSSVSPLVFTSTATVAESLRSSPPRRDAA